MAGHIADSGNLDWCTPEWILDLVREFFGRRIDLDPCWNPNAITDPMYAFSLPRADAMEKPWEGYKNVFMNPPFGISYIHHHTKACVTPKELAEMVKRVETTKDVWMRVSIAEWVKRMADITTPGCDRIALIPCYPDTKVWQHVIAKTAAAVCELEGRVKFVLPNGKTGPAPMACALVYWGSRVNDFVKTFADCGTFKFPTVDVPSVLAQNAGMQALLANLLDEEDLDEDTKKVIRDVLGPDAGVLIRDFIEALEVLAMEVRQVQKDGWDMPAIISQRLQQVKEARDRARVLQ